MVKSYHFSCGNSTNGAVGLAGSVRARSRTEALRRIRRALSEIVGPCNEIPIRLPGVPLVYVNVYVSSENIHIADVEVDN